MHGASNSRHLRRRQPVPQRVDGDTRPVDAAHEEGRVAAAAAAAAAVQAAQQAAASAAKEEEEESAAHKAAREAFLAAQRSAAKADAQRTLPEAETPPSQANAPVNTQDSARASLTLSTVIGQVGGCVRMIPKGLLNVYTVQCRSRCWAGLECTPIILRADSAHGCLLAHHLDWCDQTYDHVLTLMPPPIP